jgi:hypothetical protein
MIDDEIKKALNVDPSPEFLACVRTRIAKEPGPPAWRGSWTLAAAGAMAAVVVVAVIVSRPAPRIESFGAAGPRGPALQETPVSTAPNEPALQAETAAAPASRSARSVAGAVARPVVAGFSRTGSPQQPEILLDLAETRALRALVDGVNAGRIDLAAAQRSTPAETMVLAPIGDLEIRVMTIDPLTPAGEQGARQ